MKICWWRNRAKKPPMIPKEPCKWWDKLPSSPGQPDFWNINNIKSSQLYTVAYNIILVEIMQRIVKIIISVYSATVARMGRQRCKGCYHKLHQLKTDVVVKCVISREYVSKHYTLLATNNTSLPRKAYLKDVDFPFPKMNCHLDTCITA